MLRAGLRMPGASLVARWKANKAYLTGMETAVLETLAAAFARSALLGRLSPEGRRVIARHQAAGHHVVLVTGSLEALARPLAHALAIELVLATTLEQDAACVTGKLAGTHPYGDGKRVLVERHAAQRGLDLAASYAYADSYADLPLLLAVGHPHAVNPSPRLQRAASRRGWPILTW
jgi:HAD superfamily hydrolase (TIGR01490 family)